MVRKNKILDTIGAEQLIKDFEELGSAAKIAKKYNISEKVVQIAFKIIGFVYTKPKRDAVGTLAKYTPESIEVLFKEYKTLEKTSKFLNICLETLRRYFIEHKIPYQKRQKYIQNDNFFGQDNEKSFYWAGFFAADGGVSKNRNRIGLELKRTDRLHVEKFKLDLEATAPIIDCVKIDKRPQFKTGIYYSSRIRISSAQIKKDLQRFNIVPAKSKIYQFPEHLQNNENIRHFIRGMIDGDGSVSRSGNCSGIELCGTPICVNFIFNFLKDVCQLKSGSTYVNKDGLGSFVFTNLEDNSKIIHYLYDGATVWLDRKYQTMQDILNKCIPRKIKLDKDMLWSLFLKHKNYIDMARELKVSRSTVKRRMIEAGIMEEATKLYNQFLKENRLLNTISIKQLEEDWQNLGSVAKIAKKYSVELFAVRESLKQLGIDWHTNTNHKKHMTFEVLTEMYQRLGSVEAMAKEFNVNSGIVRYHMHKLNISFKKSKK